MSSTRTTSMFSTAPRPDPLAVIRARTLTLHAQLEARFDLSHALSSPSAYRRLLQSYLSIYLPFEQEVARQPPEMLDLIRWPLRQKVHLLLKDLHALRGLTSEPGTTQPSPSLPKLDSLDALLGALYVIEGSNLGGQIIYRQVQTRLALDEDSGAAFFHGDGENTGPTWRWFTSLLKQHIVIPERAADTACAMFSLFENGLTRPQSEVERRANDPVRPHRDPAA